MGRPSKRHLYGGGCIRWWSSSSPAIPPRRQALQISSTLRSIALRFRSLCIWHYPHTWINQSAATGHYFGGVQAICTLLRTKRARNYKDRRRPSKQNQEHIIHCSETPFFACKNGLTTRRTKRQNRKTIWILNNEPSNNRIHTLQTPRCPLKPLAGQSRQATSEKKTKQSTTNMEPSKNSNVYHLIMCNRLRSFQFRAHALEWALCVVPVHLCYGSFFSVSMLFQRSYTRFRPFLYLVFVAVVRFDTIHTFKYTFNQLNPFVSTLRGLHFWEWGEQSGVSNKGACVIPWALHMLSSLVSTFPLSITYMLYLHARAMLAMLKRRTNF